MDDTALQLGGVRKSFSIIGFAFTLLIVVASVVQLVMIVVPVRLGWGELMAQSWWTWVCTAASMYLFAFPACILLLRCLPKEKPEERKLTFKQFLTLVPICFCLMYGGNMIGTFLSDLLSGGNAVNTINDYAMDTDPLKIVVMVVLAPLLEELVCRKMLIDRTVRCGEKLSVLMSGLIFGLLHQNLFQFFYAFALGCLFGYVYVRTGRVRYSVILHVMINFLGAVVAPAVVTVLNSESMTVLMSGLETGNITPEELAQGAQLLLGIFLYSAALIVLSVWGVVLLIVKLRRMTWKSTSHQVPGRIALKASFLNAGMIVYGLLCLFGIVLALFNN